MHNEVIAPANPSIEVHMFAIAVLTAEFAVRTVGNDGRG
jgi:hypothetical protein